MLGQKVPVVVISSGSGQIMGASDFIALFFFPFMLHGVPSPPPLEAVNGNLLLSNSPAPDPAPGHSHANKRKVARGSFLDGPFSLVAPSSCHKFP